MKSRNDPPLHKSFPSPLSRSSLSCPPGFAIIIRTSPTVITDTLISTFTLTFIVFSVRLFFEFISIIILYVPLKNKCLNITIFAIPIRNTYILTLFCFIIPLISSKTLVRFIILIISIYFFNNKFIKSLSAESGKALDFCSIQAISQVTVTVSETSISSGVTSRENAAGAASAAFRRMGWTGRTEKSFSPQE